MKTLLRRFGPAVIASLALLSTAAGAFAHASLEASDPAEGGTIATPYVLVARYDEELSPDQSSIVVRNSSGAIVAQGGVAQDDVFTLVAEMPLVAPGAYAAHWIAITADDNGKTQGDINFTVVEATPSPVPTPTQPGATPGTTDQATSTPAGTVVPTTSLAPTAAPTPPPGSGGQASGSELIVPIALAVAVAIALGWFLLRRRPT